MLSSYPSWCGACDWRRRALSIIRGLIGVDPERERRMQWPRIKYAIAQKGVPLLSLVKKESEATRTAHTTKPALFRRLAAPQISTGRFQHRPFRAVKFESNLYAEICATNIHKLLVGPAQSWGDWRSWSAGNVWYLVRNLGVKTIYGVVRKENVTCARKHQPRLCQMSSLSRYTWLPTTRFFKGDERNKNQLAKRRNWATLDFAHTSQCRFRLCDHNA